MSGRLRSFLPTQIESLPLNAYLPKTSEASDLNFSAKLAKHLAEGPIKKTGPCQTKPSLNIFDEVPLGTATGYKIQ